MPGDDGRVPSIDVSRSTALAGAALLVLVLVVAGQRLAGAGTAGYVYWPKGGGGTVPTAGDDGGKAAAGIVPASLVGAWEGVLKGTADVPYETRRIEITQGPAGAKTAVYTHVTGEQLCIGRAPLVSATDGELVLGEAEITESVPAERCTPAARQTLRIRSADVVEWSSGVAKGTFFLYFPSWDDLLETVRGRLVAEFAATHPLPTEVDGPVDWPALVDWLACAFVDFTLSRRGLGEAIFHSDFAERRPLADNGVTQLTAIIRAGQEALAFGPVDPEPTARLLFGATHEAADAIAEGADREAMLAALKSLLRRTLAPQEDHP